MTNAENNILCPLRYVLSIIGGKWKLPILCILSDNQPHRYSEIKRRIPDITNMMLAQSLKELEAQGMITRIQFNEIPPHVEYHLNDGLDELIHSLEGLGRWGITHMAKQGHNFACEQCKNSKK